MSIDANSLSVNLSVTGLVLALVFLLPWIDRRTCGRLGLNLQGGLSTHPRAEALLRAAFPIPGGGHRCFNRGAGGHLTGAAESGIIK